MAEPLTFVLPEPPSLNAMITFAKKRTRRAYSGGWLKSAAPIVYDNEKSAYEARCLIAVRQAGIRLPRTAFARWELTSAHFRVHTPRDPLELLAGLKWTVDWLVIAGIVANDSPRELARIPTPTQEVDRRNRSVTITITPFAQ